MAGSFSLGKIAGIKVYIHWTFSLLILYIIYTHYKAGENPEQILWAIFFIMSIFLTVFLHELGHALAAKNFNIQTKDITLLPIGGIARIERIPEKPGEELIVAFAGPLVNLLIAFCCWFFITIPAMDELTKALSGPVGPHNFLLVFFIVNVWLAVFNLVPAFPMDGGRVLRALLSFITERYKATTIAARIGQILAFGFILLGFSNNPFLILIGLFILFGAQAEMEMVTTNFLLTGKYIGDITMQKYETLDGNENIGDAVNKLLNGTAKSFLVVQNGLPCGTLNRNEIIKALTEEAGEQMLISKIINPSLHSFDANEPIDAVYMKMNETGHELAIVTKDHQFAGVVDMDNIMEYVMIMAAGMKKR